MKRRPMEAWRALRALMANAQDTGQVFVIMRALSGDAVAKGTERFRRTASGAKLLERRRDLVPVLADHAGLANLPEGSLGRAYLALVQRADITPQGLVDVSEEAVGGHVDLDADEIVYAKRLRDAHDLWHTVTGYETDTLGEVCVVAFSYAQTRNLGFAAIALIGALKIARESGDRSVLRAAWRAFRDGRRARWLPAVEWEAMLDQPLADVRRTLRIMEPARYFALRSGCSAAVGQPA